MDELSWTPVTVVVPRDLLRRISDFGRDLAHKIWQRQQIHAGNYPRTYIPGGSSERMQRMAKLCEVAGAMACGLDPNTEIDWEIYDDAPTGPDFKLGDVRIDVKGTWTEQGRHLVYSPHSVPGYTQAEFDALLMVWAVKPEKKRNFGYCEIRGWITKDEFEKRHYTCIKGDPRRISMGSWIMHQKDLRAMSELLNGHWCDGRQQRREMFR